MARSVAGSRELGVVYIRRKYHYMWRNLITSQSRFHSDLFAYLQAYSGRQEFGKTSGRA